jgi:hypothetical protein
VITDFSISDTSITIPDILVLTVNGSGATYNNEEMTCIIHYKPPGHNWQTLPGISYTQDHWEAQLSVTNESPTGAYRFRAQLINPLGEQCEWIEIYDVLVKAAEGTINIPGFEGKLLLVIFLLCGTLKIRKNPGNSK